ncbi:Mitochondrial transcription termination factor family protein [Thalictrum thalictroides]|uniref:Mitochondrial transcription termination factor family protein n=1 Tax=Thalictrum thalictroides TaxID=46969 RepID=A0A7J6URB8_THATH|nr:Mitochondrial transcription termination factor family protein [Thalictrum thalictroides]
MPIHRLVKRIVPQVTEMYLQLSHQFVFPEVFENSLKFEKIPIYNFVGNRFFYTSRPCYVSRVGIYAADNQPSSCSIVARTPRAARTEAEEVLFDYLHCTRCMQFADAEYISKNSPNFVDKLLTKVKDDQDVTRSLTRYLRYNPINEFEPFFESLGLTAAEIPPCLPRNLMYLSDDDLLLQNYNLLFSYGIPRCKIGTMYKEEKGIFGYKEQMLSSKLRAYEHLGLSIPTVVKLVSSCPSLLVGNVNEHFVKVLKKLKSLGIQCGWLAGNMTDGSIYNWNRLFDMICFLEKMGCNKKDIGKLFKENPAFLIEDSGKKVYVLVSLLLRVGLKMDDILNLFLQHPRVLAGKFAMNLWQAVQFLSEIGLGNDEIARTVRTHSQILGSSALKKPATVLSNIKRDKLCELIREDPLNFITLASKASVTKLGRERGGHLMERTTFLLSLGYPENSEEMVKAMKRFRGRGDELQERFDCLVNAGLDFNVASNMIKVAPPVLNQSKDAIEMKIRYLVNHLGYPIKSLEGFPTFLCYSMEKIKLRFSMYKWMREKGIAKSTISLSTILAVSDARFLKYFVNVHPEGPAEWERLKKSSSSN